jgi:tRNA modification GTPase
VTDSSTIFALASGAGRAAVAVIRISGPDTAEALRALAGRLPRPRETRLAAFRDPESGEVLDRGLALWFPGPKSFTGEDMAELHLHGGRAVIAGAVAALSKIPTLRPAEPGEFARRAFLNGKLDLTAAEGIADLVAAETEAQRRQALRQMEGEFGRLLESWRERLVRALAHVEAGIDFAEDVSEAERSDAAGVAGVALEIARHLDDAGRGERLREGFSIAILGPPNAGKSSLLNRIAGRDAAIVSKQAGTTRDIVEVHLDLGGLPVALADTAGLRDAVDEVESEGVRRALAKAEAADLKLVVIEAPNAAKIDSVTKRIIDSGAIVVANKSDLCLGESANDIRELVGSLGCGGKAVVAVSAKTGAGIGELLGLIEREVAESLMPASGGAAITRARHRNALQDCVAALGRFEGAQAPELAAEDLRLAVRALGRITGRVDVEDILDVIFRDFCIGK